MDGLCTKDTLANTNYTIKLSTGSKTGTLGEEIGGTDSKVKVRLHGSKGSTHWFRCNNPGNDFEANSTGTYQLSSPDLGDISRIEVKTDNAGPGPGWLLTTVQVSNGRKTVYGFYGKILEAETRSISLGPKSEPPGNMIYTIILTTGSKKGLVGEETAGTDSKVEVQLRGSNGVSNWFRCNNPGNDFEANSTGTYQLSTSDFGEISHIDVRKDNAGPGPGWLLTTVQVSYRDKTLSGRYGRVLEAETTRISLTGDGVSRQREINYTIRLRTGSKKGILGEETAGTASKVEVRLHGSKGSSHWFRCNNPGDDFKAKSTGSYTLKSADLGNVSRIEVRKDNAGPGPGWLLATVQVSYPGKTLNGRFGRIFKAETNSINLR